MIGQAQECPDSNEHGGPEPCEDRYVFKPSVGTQQSLFGSVAEAMLTLFVCLTEGCGDDVFKPITLQNPPMVMLWVAFVAATMLGLLNLIIGLICEHSLTEAKVHEQEMEQKTEENREKKLLTLREVFVHMDSDSSNKVTMEEFLHEMQNNEVLLQLLIDLGLGDNANLFDTLDTNHNGNLSFREFFSVVALLSKGEDPCKVKDITPVFQSIIDLQKRIRELQLGHRKIQGEQTQIQEKLEDSVKRIESKLDSCATVEQINRLEEMMKSHFGAKATTSSCEVEEGISEADPANSGPWKMIL
jgi:hypothetical protein